MELVPTHQPSGLMNPLDSSSASAACTSDVIVVETHLFHVDIDDVSESMATFKDSARLFWDQQLRETASGSKKLTGNGNSSRGFSFHHLSNNGSRSVIKSHL